MSDKNSKSLSRRNVLKGFGTTAGAITVGASFTGAASASDALDATSSKDSVKRILEAVGNPEIKGTNVSANEYSGTKLSQTQLSTEVGALYDTELDNGEMSVQFHIGELHAQTKSRLPEKFQKIPTGTYVTLLWDATTEQVVLRRTATQAERVALVDAADLSLDANDEDVGAVYCDRLGGFYLNVAGENDVNTYTIVRANGEALSYDRSAVSELRGAQLDVQPPGLQAQGCLDTCAKCAIFGGGCVGCTTTCTNPISAAACIACIHAVCAAATTYFCTQCIDRC